MAISANSVFEVRTAGNDTNGGGFVTGASGTDFSQQNLKNSGANNKSTTDAVAVGTTTITSATAAFTAAIVGNIVFFSGGSGAIAAQWRQVATFVSATSITIDTAIAASTGMTMNIGGALATPGQANGIAVVGNVVFILNVGADGASVYSITSTTVSVANGCFGGSNFTFYQGYTTNRTLGNTDARPTIQINVSTATIVQTTTGAYMNLIFDGNSQTAAKLVSTASTFSTCLIKNFNTVTSGTPIFYRCQSTTNSAIIFLGNMAVCCEAYANTATGFSIVAHNCISSGNTGASSDGFAGTVNINCIAVANGRHGFFSAAGTARIYTNCHAESNTQFGFSVSAVGTIMFNCSHFGNSSGGISDTSPLVNVGTIAVTAGSVFTNAASFIFSLNNTTNQGALLRAAGDPATFPRGLTSTFRDIGAAQHQDSPSTTNIFVIDD